MRNYRLFFLVLFLSLGFLQTQVTAAPTVLEWEELIPDEGKGITLVVPENDRVVGALKREDFKEYSNEDFEAFTEEMDAQRQYQPDGGDIRTDLDGKTIRIAGYITPIEIDGENITSFLLVPYLGACIHVPSPPGNQIIFVSKAKGLTLDESYDPVWVSGKLKAKPMTTLLAEVGYRIESAKISAYDGD